MLEKIINLPFDFTKPEANEKIFIGLQEFHIQAEKGNKKLIAFVTKHIPDSIALQICLLQHYVEEQRLNDYYGIWLESVTETSLYDFFLFRNTLLTQKYFIEKDIIKSKEYFNKVLQKIKKNKIEIHPILKGRISAWDYILNDSYKIFNSFYPKLNSNINYAWFLIFYYRLIWIYKDNKFINEKIDLKSINKFQILVSVYTQEIISKYCIIYTNVL